MRSDTAVPGPESVPSRVHPHLPALALHPGPSQSSSHHHHLCGFSKQHGGNNRTALQWPPGDRKAPHGAGWAIGGTDLVSDPQPNLNLTTSASCPVTFHISNSTFHDEEGAQTSHHPPHMCPDGRRWPQGPLWVIWVAPTPYPQAWLLSL